MATEIAKAYVQILPTLKGIRANIEKELTPEAKKAGKNAGNEAGKMFSGSIKEAAKVAGGHIKKGIGSAAKLAGKAAVAGIAVAATGVAALTKQAVKNYSEYEQLVGGVETLFKDSAATTIKNAENAYKTAGLSTNQYMETVTSFSASLLQSLGNDTVKAAKYADMAIIDMSDNANKMGTSMESIQMAYQGFAKQNYTMLDNLKLGYGGTKEEMQRLLNDASKISGIKYDISSYADIVDAIHVMQTEMGIAGTTSKEAATTIQGSMSMTKAAVQNLITGLGDENADIKSLVSNVIESAGITLGNLVPTIGTVLKSIPSALKGLAPILSKELPVIFNDLIPVLISSVESMFGALSGMLPSLGGVVKNLLSSTVDFIVQNLPMVIDGIFELVMSLINVLTDPEILTTITQGITHLITTLGPKLVEMLPILIPTLVDAVMGLVNALTDPSMIAELTKVTLQVCIALIEGLVKALPPLLKGLFSGISSSFSTIGILISDAFSAAWEGIKRIFSPVAEFFTGLWKSIKEKASEAWEGIKNAFSAAGTWFNENIIVPITEFFTGLWEGIKEKAANAWNGIKSVWETVTAWFDEHIVQPIINSALFKVVAELATGAWNAIKLCWEEVYSWFNENVITPVKNFFSETWEAITGFATSAWDGIKSTWETVSTWFSDTIITPISDFFSGMWESTKTKASEAWDGIKSVWETVSTWFSDTIITPVSDFFSGMWEGTKTKAFDAWEGIKSVFGSVSTWFHDKFSEAWQKVKDVFSAGGEIFSGIKDGIEKAFVKVVNGIIRGLNKIIAVPFNAINGTLDKIRNISIAGAKPFEGVVTRFTVPVIPELYRGGVLKKGQMGLLEGDGAEAVVPLEKNTQWIRRVANEMQRTPAVGNNKSSQMMNELIKTVSDMALFLKNMRVVLDSGEVVGGISSKMDTALGINNSFAERGVAR